MPSGPRPTTEIWQKLIAQPWTAPWLLSLVLHLVMLILFGVAFHIPAKQGGGISLFFSLDSGANAPARFDGDRDGPAMMIAAGNPASSAGTATAPASSLQQLLASGPPIDPAMLLPTGTVPVGAGTLEAGGVGSASAGRTGSGSRGGSDGSGGFGQGRATTSIFGVPGEGYKFVYVFDRSGSTGGPPGRDTLTAAKAQLVASIQGLEKTHQFQIIFYNEKPVIFNPSGTPGRLAFANRANKDRAVRFVESITADGNTNHVDALKLAIRLHPDVIFFLTDGDDPKLSRRELDQIQRMATGITLNTIEFGPGPKPEEESFLATLAEENGGHYVYVDLSKYFSAESQKGSR